MTPEQPQNALIRRRAKTERTAAKRQSGAGGPNKLKSGPTRLSRRKVYVFHGSGVLNGPSPYAAAGLCHPVSSLTDPVYRHQSAPKAFLNKPCQPAR
ncbi:hypothetical protein SKAU_G00265580 [Synaphobranchus kaupii]|uniref:Uncharacterized protein n=1 Tax=Synaphobranchus kaupii TaxID=118154 RepID=A0A9Q1IQ40_SYNKA|nr:hypothetical protein SKAU_G00265580 [Synaphobranchus kaupii]